MGITQFKRKKIAILGYGREGQSLRRFFTARKIKTSVLDEKRDHKYLYNLDKFDIIFRSPGIPRLNPKILKAEKQGVRISSATKLFFDFCPCPIIGITGTKGKGTVATLIYKILKAAKNDVYLVGNIGKPAIDILPKLKKNSKVIFELSSFQLQDLHRSPHLAVVLDVTKDHLNHHKTLKEYITAKSNILKYQTQKDFAVLDFNSKIVRQISRKTKAKKIWFKRYQGKAQIIGEHNLKNIEAARVVARLLGAKDKIIKQTIQKFTGLEHRIEFVKKISGISYFNDSAATNPSATIAAVTAFKSSKILIAGGSDKGADYKKLASEIKKRQVKAIILMGETGTKIAEKLWRLKYNGKILFENKMSRAVKQARMVGQKGDTVLLSPASASFGLFKNYKDRGDQFKKAVKLLPR